MSERGKYIVIEGSDDTDKAAQAQLLVNQLTDQGISSRYVHEPWELPEQKGQFSHNAKAELTCLNARRVLLFDEQIEPGLDAGKIIVADGNWLSSAVRQGIVQELGVAAVRQLTSNLLPNTYMNPDFTAMLHTPEKDRSATSDFTKQIQQAYDTVSPMTISPQKVKGATSHNFSYIAATGTPDEINAKIVEKLALAHIIPDLRSKR